MRRLQDAGAAQSRLRTPIHRRQLADGVREHHFHLRRRLAQQIVPPVTVPVADVQRRARGPTPVDVPVPTGERGRRDTTSEDLVRRLFSLRVAQPEAMRIVAQEISPPVAVEIISGDERRADVRAPVVEATGAGHGVDRKLELR